MSEETKPLGLVRKLAEVMAAVKRVPKNGLNKFQNYKYVTEADLADMVRDELSSRNIVIFPSVLSVNRTLIPPSDKNYITEALIRWTFIDGETGESQACDIPGAGMDTGDKGIYKAITGSEKYLLMKTFLVPTGDDPEADNKAEYEQGKEAANAIGQRKAQEYIELHPFEDDADLLSVLGPALNILKSNGLGALEGVVVLDKRTPPLYIVNKANLKPLEGFCKRHNVMLILKSVQASASAMAQGNGAVVAAGAAAPSNPNAGVIDSLRVKAVTVKGEKSEKLVLEWKGKEHSVAPWFKGLFPALQKAHLLHEPIELIIEAKGEYSNVVGIHGYEKGQDGVYRKPIQRDEPPIPEDEYVPSDDDVPL